MDITTIDSSNISQSRLKVDGHIDALTADTLQAESLPLITSNKPNLCLDLSNVPYISSAGFRTLIILQKKASSFKGTIELCHVRPDIKQLFVITGLIPLFQFS